MRYKLYLTSESAWLGMIDSIKQAKKSIFLEMYIFLDDIGIKYDFIDNLIKKSLSGVRVVVVVDYFGSSKIKKESIEKMTRAGIEFIFFSHFIRRIHRKVLIVDESEAFLGGVNIGKRFLKWRDLQIKIKGKKIIRALLRSFAHTYKLAGGRSIEVLSFDKIAVSGKIKSWIIDHFPFSRMNKLRDYYTDKISKAERSIKIVTPYFIPPRWFLAILESAALRGVIVEVVVSKKTDLGSADRIGRYFMRKSFSSGIKFFLSQKMNHAKILIIDDEEILIGSQNIDMLSFHLNMETGMCTKNEKMVMEMKNVFEKWKRGSELFADEKFKMKKWDYFMIIPLRIIARIF